MNIEKEKMSYFSLRTFSYMVMSYTTFGLSFSSKVISKSEYFREGQKSIKYY